MPIAVGVISDCARIGRDRKDGTEVEARKSGKGVATGTGVVGVLLIESGTCLLHSLGRLRLAI